jgi:hypothetical protein
MAASLVEKNCCVLLIMSSSALWPPRCSQVPRWRVVEGIAAISAKKT